MIAFYISLKHMKKRDIFSATHINLFSLITAQITKAFNFFELEESISSYTLYDLDWGLSKNHRNTIGLESASKNTEHSRLNPLSASKGHASSRTVTRPRLEHHGSCHGPLKCSRVFFMQAYFFLHKSAAVFQKDGTIPEQRKQ